MKYSGQTVTVAGHACHQVNKKTAAKLFAEGKEIYLHPCNMNLHSVWSSPCPIKLDTEELKSQQEFQKICESEGWADTYPRAITPERQFFSRVSNYEMYNCVAELGRYANFFIPNN